ncbi:MAG: hypothetical protein V3U16_02195 [Candidatus Neomarinimicrobiota bacterium]
MKSPFISISSMQSTFLLILFSFGIQCLKAQDANYNIYEYSEDQLYSFQLKNGDRIIGTVITESHAELLVDKPNGEEIRIDKAEIVAKFTVEGKIKNGKLYRRDPNASVYIFAPSAFPIYRGKGFCRDFCLFFPSVNYGLTNHLSLQGGLFWYPGMDIKSTPFVGNLKGTLLNTNVFSLASGLMYVNFPATGDDEIYGAGFMFVTGTLGTEYSHGSISTGWGYIQSENGWEIMEKPIAVAALNVRVLPYLSFVSENWFYPDVALEDALLTISARFFGQQIGLDIGAIFSVNSLKDGNTPIPLISITYHYR